MKSPRLSMPMGGCLIRISKDLVDYSISYEFPCVGGWKYGPSVVDKITDFFETYHKYIILKDVKMQQLSEKV